MSRPEETPRETLADRLREGPEPNDLLWRLYWGESNKDPAIFETLARDLLNPSRSAHVLISGRYGSGKTSFIEALRKRLEQPDSLDRAPLQLFLPMPLVTGNTGTTPAAAIIGAIVENLCGTYTASPGGAVWEAFLRQGDADYRDLRSALDDLWRRAGGCAPECAPAPERESPRPNRMAGVPNQLSTRVYRANTIEHLIDRRLGWGPGGDLRGRCMLVVHLDDVDRCDRHVPAGIIEVLLRFRATLGVRFAITCDRELMARGVEDWMEANGTGADGRVYVTANSALEKYLNHIVDLPRLSDRPLPGAIGRSPLALQDGPLGLLSSRLVLEQGREPEPILSAWRGGDLDQPTLAEYLLTWLLDAAGQADILRVDEAGSLAIPPADAAPQAPALPGGAPDRQPPGLAAEGVPASATGGPQAPTSEGKSMPEGDKIQDPFKKTEAGLGGKVFRSPLTPFAEGLRELVDLDFGNRVLRLRPRYRALAWSLTPRQLKFYLRALLSGTARGESGSSASAPRESSPGITLLRQIFYAFYRLRQDEPQLFRFVAASAGAAIWGYGDRAGSRELTLFFGQVRALTSASTILTEDGLDAAWPDQHDERVLLLQLLAVIHAEDTAPGVASSSAPAGGVGGPVPSGGPVLPGGRDPDFADWVLATFGKAPEGELVADQVSSFQDYALDGYRRGDASVTRRVAEYADRFLPRHGTYFAQKSATSLSNLAVLINDVDSYEPECDRLFAEAIRVNPGQGAIPLYYAEFLATVATAPLRRARLVPAVYSDLETLLERGETLVAAAPTADANSRFYVETLRLRFDKARGANRETLVQRLNQLVVDEFDLFLDRARSGDTEPYTRLDSTLDAVLGATAQDLPDKGRILGLLWGGLERCGTPVWPVIRTLANNYVGQSKDGSLAERLGLRMNLGLLADAALLERKPDAAAPVWTQSLGVWSRRADVSSQVARSRAALGLLAALVYGGERNWQGRANGVWARVGGQGEPDPAGLFAALSPDQVSLLGALQEDRTQAGAVVEAVFADDIGEPTRTLEALVEAEVWKDWPEVQARIDELARRHCPKALEVELVPK